MAVCSRGVGVMTDAYLRPLEHGPDKFDALVVPGGVKGAETIAENSPVQHLVREYYEKGKIVGMICAGVCGWRCARAGVADRWQVLWRRSLPACHGSHSRHTQA
jgi:protein DJ-1